MKLFVFLVLLSFYTILYAESDAISWSRVSKPTASRSAQSIGKVTSGCLRGAATLTKNGLGYQVMRLSRSRYYGHPDLIQFIQNLGQATQHNGLGTLLIGDLGMARGGPTLSGHRSHQTGLDVDIWYLLSNEANKRILSTHEREAWGAPSVLKADGKRIDPSQWSLANEQILESAARSANVDRIFVNPRVKQVLCERKSNRYWLQKIRPWYAHADHFHVRLKCPENSQACEKQEPVPPGDGCGSDLTWWFSAEANTPSKKIHTQKPPLPQECNTVLTEN